MEKSEEGPTSTLTLNLVSYVYGDGIVGAILTVIGPIHNDEVELSISF